MQLKTYWKWPQNSLKIQCVLREIRNKNVMLRNKVFTFSSFLVRRQSFSKDSEVLK